MRETWFYAAQRITAVVLLPMVVAHLATIIYASKVGLTADAILARAQASPWLAVFYASFVIAASIHAPLGIRMVLLEWGRMPRAVAGWCSFVLFLLLLGLGMRGVAAITNLGGLL